MLGQLGRRERKGAPDTFDVEGFVTALDRVRAPGTPEVMVPVYQRDLHEPIAAGSLIRGSGVVVCEGNYLAVDSGGWQWLFSWFLLYHICHQPTDAQPAKAFLIMLRPYTRSTVCNCV